MAEAMIVGREAVPAVARAAVRVVVDPEEVEADLAVVPAVAAATMEATMTVMTTPAVEVGPTAVTERLRIRIAHRMLWPRVKQPHSLR